MKKEWKIFVIIEMVEWEIRAKGKKGQKVFLLLLNKISVGGSWVVQWCKDSLPSFDTWLHFQCKQNPGSVLHPKAAWEYVRAEMENEIPRTRFIWLPSVPWNWDLLHSRVRVRLSLALGTRWNGCFPVLMRSLTLYEVKKDPEEPKSIIFIPSDLAEFRGSRQTKISPWTPSFSELNLRLEGQMNKTKREGRQSPDAAAEPC